MQTLEHPTHVFRANNERGRYKASELSLLFLQKKEIKTHGLPLVYEDE
jgi:hypothetical protein